MRLSNPTGRNTQARILEIGDADLFFSYETCIAVRFFADAGPIKVRRANSWGPTTGRHFKDLGCKDFDVVSDAEFEATLYKLAAPFRIGGHVSAFSACMDNDKHLVESGD